MDTVQFDSIDFLKVTQIKPKQCGLLRYKKYNNITNLLQNKHRKF
jgi:hypothetical protein